MSDLTVGYRVSFRKRDGSALVATPPRGARPVPSVTASAEAPAGVRPSPAAALLIAEAHPTARLLALAHRVERMVQAGELRDYREAAARFGISHARMSQVTGMLLLSPRIQADILLGRVAATEGGLRSAVRAAEWISQRQALRPLPQLR